MKRAAEKIAELERLIALIEEKKAAVPALVDHGTDWDAASAARDKWHRAYNDILLHLAEKEGAKTGSSPFAGHALRLAGVQSTCTYGAHGLLSNWQLAAHRRIAKLMEGGGA